MLVEELHQKFELLGKARAAWDVENPQTVLSEAHLKVAEDLEHCAIQLLSTLLLSLEQVLDNKFNPSRQRDQRNSTRASHMPQGGSFVFGDSKPTPTSKEKLNPQTLVPPTIYKRLQTWLTEYGVLNQQILASD